MGLEAVMNVDEFRDIKKDHPSLHRLFYELLQSERLKTRESAGSSTLEEQEKVETLLTKHDLHASVLVDLIRSWRSGGNRTSFSSRLHGILQAMYQTKRRAATSLSFFGFAASPSWSADKLALIALFYIICVLPALAREMKGAIAVAGADNHALLI